MGIYRQQLIRNFIEIMIQRWPIFLIEGGIIIIAIEPEFSFVTKTDENIDVVYGSYGWGIK